MTTVRLALTVNQHEIQNSLNYEGSHRKPALLVSYAYLDNFTKHRHNYTPRDWAIDSGAFSAMKSGKTILLNDYINTCLSLRQIDQSLSDIFSLDVIGDPNASIVNNETMWANGVEAIPTFHLGSSWGCLLALARDYPKIAIGGCVGQKHRLKFAEQCFARVWPKRIHGFGFGDEKSILALPWHSVDSTSWSSGPCQFGRWNAFGGKMPVRKNRNLKAEVDWYLDLELKAKDKWAKEMKMLETL